MMPLSSQLIKHQRSFISQKKILKSWENLLRNSKTIPKTCLTRFPNNIKRLLCHAHYFKVQLFGQHMGEFSLTVKRKVGFWVLWIYSVGVSESLATFRARPLDTDFCLKIRIHE